MASRSAPFDRAGRDYWDTVWSAGEPGGEGGLRLGHVDRRFLGLVRSLAGERRPGAPLLELGCARSPWLVHFARELGFSVTGLDYSERGCAQARELLARAGVDGRVVHADLFAPPAELRGAFDVVVSLGVAEHFDDTDATIRAFAAFLAEGGTLVTVVPNMHGTIGLLQRWLNEPVYAIHTPLTPGRLGAAHAAAGLAAVRAEYFLSTHFGVPNLNGLPPGPATRLKVALLAGLVYVSKAVWAAELVAGRELPVTRAFSPYAVAVGTRPGGLRGRG